MEYKEKKENTKQTKNKRRLNKKRDNNEKKTYLRAIILQRTIGKK